MCHRIYILSGKDEAKLYNFGIPKAKDSRQVHYPYLYLSCLVTLIV